MSKKYKVIGNGHGIRHNFEIGEIVKRIIYDADSGECKYRDGNGLEQWVSSSDVRPVKRSFIDIIKGWFNHG